jgi:hypothetical protein
LIGHIQLACICPIEKDKDFEREDILDFKYLLLAIWQNLESQKFCEFIKIMFFNKKMQI